MARRRTASLRTDQLLGEMVDFMVTSSHMFVSPNTLDLYLRLRLGFTAIIGGEMP